MATTKSITLKGSCSCGAVTVTTTTAPISITFCHCSRCRKEGGGAFMPYGSFKNESLQWIGTIKEKHSVNIQRNGVPIAIRGSCAECGTPVWMKYHCNAGGTDVAMGIIDDGGIEKVKISEVEHIYLNDKVPWFNVPETDKVRFEGMPEEFDGGMDKWVEDGCPQRRDVSEY